MCYKYDVPTVTGAQHGQKHQHNTHCGAVTQHGGAATQDCMSLLLPSYGDNAAWVKFCTCCKCCTCCRQASKPASKQASKQPGAFPQHNIESSALTWPYTLARPCESWCLRSSISFFFRFSSARVSLRTPSLLAALPCTCCSSLPLPYTHKQRFLNPKLVQVFCHK